MERGGNRKQRRADKNQVRENKVNEGQRQIKEKFITQNKLPPPIQAKNDLQREFLKALKFKQLIIFEAPAGVGKSFVTMSEICDWLKQGYYDKCYLTRPAVGMGQTVGLLKGGLREKYEPYLAPLVDVIKQRYGNGFYESSLHNGTFEYCLLEYIRGKNISDVVVVDECQNVYPSEMYTILTRIAEGGKIVMLGDRTQKDIKGKSGIEWIMEFVDRHPELKEYVAVIQGTSDEIVRGSLCKIAVQSREKDVEDGMTW